MNEKIKVDDLRIGMYVQLSSSWFSHSFARSSFKISGIAEIKEMRKQGMTEVEVDREKSDPKAFSSPPEEEIVEVMPYLSHGGEVEDPREGEAPKQWDPTTLVPTELLTAIEDKTLTPEKKSKVVYEHSLVMMKRLLETPAAENIKASKKVVGSITNMILSDDKTAQSMLRITSHDFYTYTHSVNVGVTSIMLAKALFRKSNAHDLEELGAGFFLHDLGKIMVNPDIINKPAKLTEEEMREIRIHPYQGYKLLKAADALSDECRYIIMQHHEHLDGTGYPRSLKDNDIHIYGRICCIADIFDALTAERSYKKAMTPFDALALMKKIMSNRFDSELFRTFVMLYH